MKQIFFFICVFLVFSCSNDTKELEKYIEKEKVSNESMDTVTISHTENGILKVKINANKLERFSKPESIVRISNSLEVFFYDSKEKIKSFLSAKNAEINETTNIMTASDQVVLNSVNGKKLETEELTWDDKKNLIYTNKRVIITTDKEVIQGTGFESNPDFTKYTITKIHGTFEYNVTKN